MSFVIFTGSPAAASFTHRCDVCSQHWTINEISLCRFRRVNAGVTIVRDRRQATPSLTISPFPSSILTRSKPGPFIYLLWFVTNMLRMSSGSLRKKDYLPLGVDTATTLP
jgi:hypothetical protein